MQLKVTALSRQNDALRRQLRSLRQGEGVEMANTDELREYASAYIGGSLRILFRVSQDRQSEW